MLTRITPEPYVPQWGGHRDAWSRGEPALIVAIKPPSAAERQALTLAMSTSVHLPKIQDRPPHVLAQLLLLDPVVSGPLFRACIREFSGAPLTLDDGTVVADGAALWALREQIDAAELYQELLAAAVDRGQLDAGAVRFLGRPPASAPSPGPTNGTAASVAPLVSTPSGTATASS